MENKKLRPCPHCNKEPSPIIVDGKIIGAWCHCYDKWDYPKGSIGFKTEHWNSAWCWKELDRLKAENETLKAEIKNLNEREIMAVDEGDELRAENQKLREEIKRKDEALRFICERENATFAECSLAEEIMDKAKEALDGK